VVKPIPEKNLNQLTLTEEALRRLAIQTAPVREEQVVRKRMVGGEVMAVPEESTTITASSAGTIAGPNSGNVPLVGTSLSSGQVVLRLIPSDTSETPVDLKAPQAATLIRLMVKPGQQVAAGDPLFEVADISKVLVRALVYVGEVNKVDRAKPATILPLARSEQANGLTAKVIEMPTIGDGQTSTAAMYYLVDSSKLGLVPGQRVLVEF
jgi:biotin carboxyl carrier protein